MCKAILYKHICLFNEISAQIYSDEVSFLSHHISPDKPQSCMGLNYDNRDIRSVFSPVIPQHEGKSRYKVL